MQASRPATRLAPTLLSVTLAAALLLGAERPALAIDGVIEINHSVVMAAGGYPYRITQSGSYRLTGNLQVPDENTRAIQVQVDSVTIDLNGFEIVGPNTCSGSPPGYTCAFAGSADGIYGLPHDELTVMNGTIRGMGNRGIWALDRFRGERLRLLHNAGDGLEADEEAQIVDCHAAFNGRAGIKVDGHSKVTGNVTRLNNHEGIYITYYSVARDNTSSDNGRDGIYSHVGGNTITHNNASSNVDDGIDANANDLVVDNVAVVNQLSQLETATTTAYGDNNLSGTTPVNGTPISLGVNVCNGALCP